MDSEVKRILTRFADIAERYVDAITKEPCARPGDTHKEPEECVHDSDGSKYRAGGLPCQYFLATEDTTAEDMWLQCKKCMRMYQCVHESDGYAYDLDFNSKICTSAWGGKDGVIHFTPHRKKCKKCGEFYR